MFGKLIDALGDLDPAKLKDTVEAVWEHKDDLGQAIRWVVEHRDSLVHLLETLPHLLGTAGGAMEAAGEAAVRSARFLTGGSDDGVSVQSLTELAGDALERCQRELGSATGILSKVGDIVDGIKLPSVRPTYTEIAGFRVVSGVDFDESGFADGAAEQLRDGASRLANIAGDLLHVAEQLRHMGGALHGVGGDLHAVGGHLASSGSTLRGLLGGSAEPAAGPL